MSAVLPMNAACPRCGGPFHCGAAEATCACFDLPIDPALRAQLTADYIGCLCVNCLAALQIERKEKQEP